MNPIHESNYHVLIIDDEKAMADLLAKRLNKVSPLIETSVLVEPLDANKRIKNHMPDLVLLDYRMPSISGVDCLIKIRSEFPKVDLPVIVFTSEDSSDLIVKCFEEGANDYVIKGAPTSVIVSRVLSQIRLTNLMKDQVKLKQLEALMALVVSYNHEINNPLSVAMVNLEFIKGEVDVHRFQKIETALKKISEVVKSLKAIGNDFDLEYTKYTDQTKMLKIK